LPNWVSIGWATEELGTRKRWRRGGWKEDGGVREEKTEEGREWTGNEEE
jgi:hypothetical protein